VLDTLVHLKHETDVWFEVTTLLIPGENDSPAEIEALSAWFAANLGPDVPLHFTAFHPDWKMLDKPRTPVGTLFEARRIARAAGLRYVYTGNVHAEPGQSTYCHACGERLIGRDWYELTAWNLTPGGRCASCGAPCAGVFEGPARRLGPPAHAGHFPASASGRRDSGRSFHKAGQERGCPASCAEPIGQDPGVPAQRVSRR
jgi:pyruvate formate lyase activating enzyme